MQEDLQTPEIVSKINEIAAVAPELPGVIIIHRYSDLSVLYMSPRGKEILGVTQEELKAMGPDYHKKFFNPEDAQDYTPKVIGMLERNTEEWVSFFQQVRRSEEHNWTWYLTSTKIFMRNGAGEPMLA